MTRLLSAVILILLWSRGGNTQETLKFSAMIFGETKSVYRGALTWSHPSSMLGIGIILYEQLKIYGPRVFWEPTKRDDILSYKIGLAWYDDDRPWITTGGVEDYKNSRNDSLEMQASVHLKYGFRNLFATGIMVARDFISYRGWYFEFHQDFPLIPYLKLKTKVGWGGTSTHHYLYGLSGKAGAGFVECSLQYVIRNLPWNGMITLSESYSKVLSDENQKAELIRGDDQHLTFSLRMLYFF